MKNRIDSDSGGAGVRGAALFLGGVVVGFLLHMGYELSRGRAPARLEELPASAPISTPAATDVDAKKLTKQPAVIGMAPSKTPPKPANTEAIEPHRVAPIVDPNARPEGGAPPDRGVMPNADGDKFDRKSTDRPEDKERE